MKNVKNITNVKVRIEKISKGNMSSNALIFLPKEESPSPRYAIFTHGYTSHKGSILSWGKCLAELGFSAMVFDLPGHYLGSYNEVDNFEEFKNDAHHLFYEGFKKLVEISPDKNNKDEPKEVLLGGHSLGAFLALKATSILEFNSHRLGCVLVGIGMDADSETSEEKSAVNQDDEALGKDKEQEKLFTRIHESILSFRCQLVSPCLAPKNIYSWMKAEKKQIIPSGKRIHLITGEDDNVFTAEEVKRLFKILEVKGNSVTIELPNHIPHYRPEMAVHRVYLFAKKYFLDS